MPKIFRIATILHVNAHFFFFGIFKNSQWKFKFFSVFRLSPLYMNEEKWKKSHEMIFIEIYSLTGWLDSAHLCIVKHNMFWTNDFMNQNGVYNSIVSQLLGLPSGSPTIAGCRLASTSDLKQCYSMRMGTHSHLYNIRNFFFVIWLLLVYSGTHYIFVFAPSLHCMAQLSDKIMYSKYYKHWLYRYTLAF